jgi:(S)-mandelate dehydrogenase
MSIEAIAEAASGELWFQLYVVHRRVTELLVKRALSVGYTTLVLTTDVGVNGKRERDARNGFSPSFHYNARTVLDGILHPRWLWAMLRNGHPELANFVNGDAYDAEISAALLARRMDTSFDWTDLARLRELWPHKLLVKGISRVDDAERCIEFGADGVILSNHGGRQLDSAISPLEVLEATVSRVSAPVLIDSGIRRGADVVKAVALGAKSVLLGRAALYGLATSGERGVGDVLSMLKDEIDRTLALIGCPAICKLNKDYLWTDRLSESSPAGAYTGSLF